MMPLTAFAFILALLFVTENSGVSRAREVKACDIVVQRLMATHDLVELKRDEWLVQKLWRGVDRRVVRMLVPAEKQ